MQKNKVITVMLVAFSLASCAHKSGHNKKEENQVRSEVSNDYIQNDTRGSSDRSDRKIDDHTKITMEKKGGIYFVPITVNGLNLNFIFDTGASSISLSIAEALVMERQGMITEEDIVGQTEFADATGTISVGTVILLRTVQIGDIVLHNVEASVVDNIQAPLLLGQTALAKFGKVTIDYEHNTIEFN